MSIGRVELGRGRGWRLGLGLGEWVPWYLPRPTVGDGMVGLRWGIVTWIGLVGSTIDRICGVVAGGNTQHRFHYLVVFRGKVKNEYKVESDLPNLPLPLLLLV